MSAKACYLKLDLALDLIKSKSGKGGDEALYKLRTDL